MKKLFALLLTLAMVLSLAACGGNSGGSDGGSGSGASGSKVIKIGIYEPSSGANGAGGKKEVLGIEYANTQVSTVTIGGEEYSIELVPVDNQSENDKGVSAAQQLVSSGVAVVLGSYGSGVSMAASDTFKDAGIAAMGVTCTNPNVTAGNDHYFRICFLDDFQANGALAGNDIFIVKGMHKGISLFLPQLQGPVIGVVIDPIHKTHLGAVFFRGLYLGDRRAVRQADH